MLNPLKNPTEQDPTDVTDSFSDRLRTTQTLLREALTEFEPSRIALSFSGAEDVVLIDLIEN